MQRYSIRRLQHQQTRIRQHVSEIAERGDLKKEGLRDRVIAEIKTFADSWAG